MMLTSKIIRDLDSHLTIEGYYEIVSNVERSKELNTRIVENWHGKVENSLRADFREILANDDLNVNQHRAIFNIMDEEAQGATLWTSYFTLIDRLEKLDVVIRFLVNYDHGFIYLGAGHTHLDPYPGTSDALKWLFKRLKSNGKTEHFSHTKLNELGSRR